MNNCTGYIRTWDPRFQSGVIFGCDGGTEGLNVAFRFVNIDDPALQHELTVCPAFELARDYMAQPDGALSVSFFYDGGGFALNILSR